MPIAAYPSPANRSQTITINLGGDNQTDTELQVVNMNGQVLDRRTIPAGQQQTTLPVSRFAPGANLYQCYPKRTTRRHRPCNSEVTNQAIRQKEK